MRSTEAGTPQFKPRRILGFRALFSGKWSQPNGLPITYILVPKGHSQRAAVFGAPATQLTQKLNTIRWDPPDTLMPDSVRILEGQAGRGSIGEVGFPQSPDRPLTRGVEVALMGTSCGKRMPPLPSWGNQGSASF